MELFARCIWILAEVSFRVRYGAPSVSSLRKIGVNLYRRTPRLPVRDWEQRVNECRYRNASKQAGWGRNRLLETLKDEHQKVCRSVPQHEER